MATTPRAALRYPVGTDPVDINQYIQNLATDADNVLAMFSQGTFAARPTSTPGSPGKQGRVYYATDTGKVYYDYGTGWVILNADIPTLGPDSITATEIAAGAVGSSELADNAVDIAAIQDNAVTFAKLAAALKPSQGAGGAAEALRAIGSGAGNVIAGNDSRLSEGAAGTATVRSLGTGATQAAAGNDSRLAEGAAGVATVRSLGTGATQAAAGNDARLSDDREPLDSWKGHFSALTDQTPGASSGGTWGTLVIPQAGTYIVRMSGRIICAGQGGNMTVTLSAPISKAFNAGGFGWEHFSPAYQITIAGSTTITVTYNNNDTSGSGEMRDGSLHAIRIA